ncbi:MAG: hypothetical protein ACTSYF_17785 [Promethearchaeota archaeon]
MGLFDTIIFPNPIPCEKCGNAIESTQIKAFGNLLRTYKVGSIIQSPIVDDIMKENLFCDTCKHFKQFIYLVIFKGILIAIEKNENEARKMINAFGKGELYFLYVDLYKEKEEWRKKFLSLKSLLETYIDYLKLTNEEREKLENDPLRALCFSEIKECLERVDLLPILECILQKGIQGEGFFL